MRWHLLDSNTLEETESGYQIHLLSGTWFHPGKLKPKAPESMDFPQQIQCLRSGLQHIRRLGGQRNGGEMKSDYTTSTETLYRRA